MSVEFLKIRGRGERSAKAVGVHSALASPSPDVRSGKQAPSHSGVHDRWDLELSFPSLGALVHFNSKLDIRLELWLFRLQQEAELVKSNHTGFPPRSKEKAKPSSRLPGSTRSWAGREGRLHGRVGFERGFGEGQGQPCSAAGLLADGRWGAQGNTSPRR